MEQNQSLYSMEAQISQFRDEWRKTNSRIVGALTLLILAGLPASVGIIILIFWL